VPTPVSGIRPIVFGRPVSESGALAGPFQSRPALVLSVHAESGRLLGYAILDRAAEPPGVGGRTIGQRIPIEQVCALARASTLQTALFGVPGPTHHCYVIVPDGASPEERERREREFDATVAPAAGGIFTHSDFTVVGGGIVPIETARVTAAVAATVAVAALRAVRDEPRTSTFACESEGLGQLVRDALADHGLAPAASDAAEADVRIVSEGPWVTRPHASARTRAEVVVSLDPTSIVSSSNLTFSRRALVVPDALGGAGRVLAPVLRRASVPPAEVPSRAETLAEETFLDLFALARSRGTSLSAAVLAAANGLVAASA
jgi:hypothetical protein